MKLNKWTLGLAALGLVSLAPGLRAQSTMAPTPTPLTTALSSTTISGYVDTSAIWVPGTGDAHPAPVAFNTPQKQDGFNLDSVDVRLSKAADDTTKWTAGYVLELQYGPDAINPFGGTPIRQAYVDLVAPVGNGLHLQMGQFDNILGYESNDDYKNPNFTRSYGYSLEPVSHTGLLLSYQFCEEFSAEAGVADSITSQGNANSFIAGANTGVAESKKSFISLLTLTAPKAWGSLAGSTLSAGYDQGTGTSMPGADREELYVGTTINTPLKGLTFGASWDAVWNDDMNIFGFPLGAVTPATEVNTGYNTSYAGYMVYGVTDKLSLSARGEYFHGSAAIVSPLGLGYNADIMAYTGTLQYNLWANVITRLEVRWDHVCNSVNNGDLFGGTGAPTEKNQVLFAANVIYKF